MGTGQLCENFARLPRPHDCCLVAEIERNLISMRTKEALALRKAEGMVLGRKKGTYTKFNILIANRRAVIQMLDQGKPITDVCKHYTLSCGMFDKFRRSYPSVQQAVWEKERYRINRFKRNRQQVPS